MIFSAIAALPPGLLAGLGLLCLASWGMASAAASEGPTPPAGPWPVAVPGWVAPAPGEHPRLFFRKGDVAALRARAQTPEGNAMLARLKWILGGGEAMPTVFSKSQKGYTNKESFPVGTYTLWHAMGFGFLYVITEDKKYAELSKQCVEKAFAGVRDIDDRMAWVRPSECMRAGQGLSAVALAYDLCYDGWTPEFRQQVALAIQNYDQAHDKGGKGDPPITLEQLSCRPFMKPSSNHFGLQVGGAGLADLAIQGDPGVDDAKVKQYLAGNEQAAMRLLTEGYGDGGYFYEHPGPGWIAVSWTFIPWLQAMRVCAGKDYVSPRTNARYMIMKFAAQCLPSDKGPLYPNPTPGGGYGTEEMVQNGGHHAGYFSEGFGAIRPQDAPALLWVYNHFVEPSEAKLYPNELKPGEKSYDAFRYPLRAVLAFINWPLGVEPQNPETVVPKVTVDHYYGHFVFRNQWKDENDILVAVLFGARTMDKAKRVMVWGLKEKLVFGNLQPSGPNPKSAYFQAAEDGSGVVSCGGNSIGVDYSKASGADAVVVMVGPAATGGRASGKARIASVTAGKTTFSILTLAAGAHPEAKADGDKVVLGGQTISYDGTKILFGKMAGPPQVAQ